MNLIGVLTLCVVVVIANAADQRYYDINEAPKYFAQFMIDYNRTYKNEEDKAVHYAAFIENLKSINRLNAISTTATFGINKFSDYTAEEEKHLHGFKPPRDYEN